MISLLRIISNICGVQLIVADTSPLHKPPYGVDATMRLRSLETRWLWDMMDEGHTRPAWPPHSYDNIYFIQRRYESVELSSQNLYQTRLPPALRHKAAFPYECLLRL